MLTSNEAKAVDDMRTPRRLKRAARLERAGLALILLAFLAIAPFSQAESVLGEFTVLENNSQQWEQLIAQFSVEIWQEDLDTIGFTFSNRDFSAEALAATITDVYVYESAPQNLVLDADTGRLPENWDTPARPGHLPGIEQLVPDYEDSLLFSMVSSGADKTPNGLELNDAPITFYFDLVPVGTTASDLFMELYAGDILVGLKVQAIEGAANGDSDTYYTTTFTAVPVPGAAGIGFLGLAFMCVTAKARRRLR